MTTEMTHVVTRARYTTLTIVYTAVTIQGVTSTWASNTDIWLSKMLFTPRLYCALLDICDKKTYPNFPISDTNKAVS